MNYNIGDVVKHHKFGVGVVTKIETRTDGDPLVFVKFDAPYDTKRFTNVSLSKHSTLVQSK